jgi:hypothetical protein
VSGTSPITTSVRATAASASRQSALERDAANLAYLWEHGDDERRAQVVDELVTVATSDPRRALALALLTEEKVRQRNVVRAFEFITTVVVLHVAGGEA